MIKTLEIESLKEVFSKYPVKFAYIFGSQTTGNTGPLSDVDIAIYLDDGISNSDRFDYKLKIAGELDRVLRKDKIDIVVLNEAYPLLEHRIIKYGRPIYSSDEKKRVDYETKAVMRYLDFKPFIERSVIRTLYDR